MLAIRGVEMKRQQLLVFRVCKKQQAKENQQRHLVRLRQFLGRGVPKPARLHQRRGEPRHDLLVDAFPQATAQLRRVVGASRQNVGERSTRNERVGGTNQPEITRLRWREQVEVELSIGFRTSAAPRSYSWLHRIDSQYASRGDHDIVEILLIRLRKRMGDRRHVAELCAGRFDVIGAFQENRNRHVRSVSHEQRLRTGKLLDSETQSFKQLTAAKIEEGARACCTAGPVLTVRHTGLELVKCEKPSIIKTGYRCTELAERRR